MKFLIALLILIVCTIICILIKRKEKRYKKENENYKGSSFPLIFAIATGVIPSILVLMFVPQNISIYDLFDNHDITKETQKEESQQQELIITSNCITELPIIEAISIPNKIETNAPINTQEPESEFTNTTASITSPPDKDVLIILNANGGNVASSEIILKYGEFYNLPTPKRDYFTFKGWYTAIDGGSLVNNNSIVTNTKSHTLYAHWEYNEVSGWVYPSQVAPNADIVDRKWTYMLTETKESNNPSESGWTLVDSYWKFSTSGTKEYATFPINSNGYEYYNTSDKYYKQYSNVPEISNDSNVKREITSEQVKSYIYYHWSYPLKDGRGETNRLIGDYYGEVIKSGNTNLGKATIWESFEGGYIEYNPEAKAYEEKGHSQYSYWWNGRIPVYIQNYTDYIKTYQFERETQKESETKIVESGNISNVKEWVKYQIR